MGKTISSRTTVKRDFLHNHNYYNRECKICRQYVKDIYNNYFDNVYRMNTMNTNRYVTQVFLPNNKFCAQKFAYLHNM